MKRKMKRTTRTVTAGPKKKRNRSKPGRAPVRKAGMNHQQARTAANPFMPAPMVQYSPVQRIDPETMRRLEQNVEALQQRHSASASQREFWGIILKTLVITLPLVALLALAAFTDVLNSVIGELVAVLLLYFIALAAYFWRRNRK